MLMLSCLGSSRRKDGIPNDATSLAVGACLYVTLRTAKPAGMPAEAQRPLAASPCLYFAAQHTQAAQVYGRVWRNTSRAHMKRAGSGGIQMLGNPRGHLAEHRHLRNTDEHAVIAGSTLSTVVLPGRIEFGGLLGTASTIVVFTADPADVFPGKRASNLGRKTLNLVTDDESNGQPASTSEEYVRGFR
jgi:hypothetical protein